MPVERTRIEKADDLDILSAIWILSCNDENPILTYKGIHARLGLSETFDVNSLVRSRSELFRPRVVNSRLTAWKQQMKAGKGRPAWITEIRDKKEQEAAIDAITRDDVFRNQFRVGADAPTCDIKIIDWGLNHIDRLRKSAAEEKEARSKRWGTVIIPLTSILLAALSIVATSLIQRESLQEQRELKKYEVSFKPKQEAYSSFMSALTKAAFFAQSGDEANAMQEMTRMDATYYSFEPFLSESDRKNAFDELTKFQTLCNQRLKIAKGDEAAKPAFQKDFLDKLNESKSYFHTALYYALFSSEQQLH